MFLEQLSEYANQIGLPPPRYQPRPIRYKIRLAQDGIFEKVIEVDQQLLTPHCKRTVAITPILLADTVEYTLGLAKEKSKPGRVQTQHAAYVTMVKACASATGEPAVAAVAHFLANEDLLQIAQQEHLSADANVVFEVGETNIQPTDCLNVQQFWAKFAAAVDDTEPSMQCLVCGEMRPPVKRLPIVIKHIPDGPSMGLTLISANAKAFESYGLEASLIAPTCEDCGERFGNALNALLSQDDTHVIIPPLAYVFWTRDPQANLALPRKLQAAPDEVEALLKAQWRGKPEEAALNITPFYAAILSASGSRVVIRDWIETTLGNVQENLSRYFQLQRMERISGKPPFFSLWELLHATVKHNGKEKPLAQVGQGLLRVALRGGQLPDSLLYQVIRRIRADHNVQSAQAALIKMVLLSQQDQRSLEEGRGHNMATVNEDCKEAAYLCGRLLAQLNSIQRLALGKVNATIVDRYYGTASTAPASVFGRLLRGVQPHLATIRQKRSPQYAGYLDKELSLLLDDLKEIPPVLSLKEQGWFALGYYHQKASLIKSKVVGEEEDDESGSVSDEQGSQSE